MRLKYKAYNASCNFTIYEFLSLQIENNTYNLFFSLFWSEVGTQKDFLLSYFKAVFKFNIRFTQDQTKLWRDFPPELCRIFFLMEISATFCTHIFPFPFSVYSWKKNEL